MTPYVLTSHALVLRDTPEHIDFHIKNGDYIAFLATMMGFLQEGLEKCSTSSKEYELAADLLKDLRHVHKHYQVVPRDQSETHS